MANVNTDELGHLGLSQAEERGIVALMGTLSDAYAPDAGQRERHPAVQRSPH